MQAYVVSWYFVENEQDCVKLKKGLKLLVAKGKNMYLCSNNTKTILVAISDTPYS